MIVLQMLNWDEKQRCLRTGQKSFDPCYRTNNKPTSTERYRKDLSLFNPAGSTNRYATLLKTPT